MADGRIDWEDAELLRRRREAFEAHIPKKERRCDLGPACICTKAGWKGECLRVEPDKDVA